MGSMSTDKRAPSSLWGYRTCKCTHLAHSDQGKLPRRHFDENCACKWSGTPLGPDFDRTGSYTFRRMRVDCSASAPNTPSSRALRRRATTFAHSLSMEFSSRLSSFLKFRAKHPGHRCSVWGPDLSAISLERAPANGVPIEDLGVSEIVRVRFRLSDSQLLAIRHSPPP